MVKVFISGYPHGCSEEKYYKYSDIPHFNVWIFVKTTHTRNIDDLVISDTATVSVISDTATVYEETCMEISKAAGFRVIKHEHDSCFKIPCNMPVSPEEAEEPIGI